MKTMLVTDVETRFTRVVFDPPFISMLAPETIHELSTNTILEFVYPTPCLDDTISILRKDGRHWNAICEELMDLPKVAHGAMGGFTNSGCRGPLCSWARSKHHKGTLAQEPDEGSDDWAIWHFVLAHRLNCKVVRKMRIEIW